MFYNNHNNSNDEKRIAQDEFSTNQNLARIIYILSAIKKIQNDAGKKFLNYFYS